MNLQNYSLVTTIFFCFAIVIFSCQKELENSGSFTNILELPEEDYEYANAPNASAKLGRVLFYDKSLSVNNSVACGSCHKQAYAFADNKTFSVGFESRSTKRNSPALQNLNSGQRLFWDGRATSMTGAVAQPLFDHLEMGMGNSGDVTRRVASRGYYPELFLEAFGSEKISFEKITEALSDFVVSIESRTSKFERDPNALSDSEQRGLELFIGKYDCGSCHDIFSPIGYNGFGGNELVNVGLEVQYNDKGHGDVSGNPDDDGKFKIPNLRNVAVTGPYMHDGRFETLEDAINHYSTGIRNHRNLDFRLKDPQTENPLVFNIPEEDLEALKAFLESLTDYGLLTDPKFSNPFTTN